MGRNSFLLKGWSVTLVAAIFALTARNTSIYFVAVAILPALAFWGLDAYYLRRERLFRELYKDVVRGNVSAFSMDTSRYEREVPSWFKAVGSVSALPFHGVVAGAVVLVIVVMRFLV